ncbi:MAG: cache domain-containing protein [Candidatus Magasanikbacteria bacterium]|nr:cache domain-containing protein [Candidatus Magasanikbacteria bacterium]
MEKFIKKNKLALGLCVIFGILLVGLVFFGLNVQKRQVIDAHKESLQILANEKAAEANNFLESQREKLEIIGSVGVFKEVVKDPNNTAKIETAKKRINELSPIIHRIAIFTKEGIMFIAESGPTPIDYSTLPYFVSKDKKIIFMRYYDPFQKRDYYSVLGPIFDRIEKDKVIGAIAFDVELDKISSLMKETLEKGKGNEVYLIDETGLLLSGSEYIGKSNKRGVLIQEIESDGAIECLEHVKKYGNNESVEEHIEEVIQYTNYMGDEVFGAHAYVPSIMGCVIAEENANEIFGFSIIDYIKKIINNQK